MEDKNKTLDFEDFLVTKYGYDDDYTEHRRKKLKNGAMHEETESEEELDEVLSRQQRLKASQRMKRMGKRIAMARKRALRRAPTMDVLTKRAEKQAKNQLVQKWTRGQKKSDLSIGRRTEIEKRLKKSKTKWQRNAKRMLPDLRKKDRDRRAGQSSGNSKKES